MRSLLCIAATVGLALSACSTAAPQVTVANGIVEGFCVNDDVVQVNGFFGIPFAEPPVRFEANTAKKPVPKTNWTGVKATKTMPAMCTQATPGDSEDCLYLNVYAPDGAASGSLPVFVIVHGGAFAFGSANDGTPAHIAKYLAAKGLVIVMIQYRVGPLGFCTTKDSVMPGNYGMWDAKMAFEWVRDNIAAFGGNPNDVTAYGGSSGAALIDAMHLSPLATNLFHKMALFSGAATDIWDAPTKQKCEERAASLGLTWTDSASFKAAMLSAPASGLGSGWLFHGESTFDTIYADWSPVYDGDFFPTTGAAMRAATQPKPSIYGISFLEGAGTSGALNITSETVEKIVNYMVPATVGNRSLFQSYLIESYRNQALVLEPTAIDKHAAQAALGERNRAAGMDAVLRRNFELFGTNQTYYRYVFKHFNPATIGTRYPFISFASHAFDQYYSIGKPGFTFTGDDLTVVNLYTTPRPGHNPNGAGPVSSLAVPWVASTPANPSLNYVIESTPSMDPQFFFGRPHLNNVLNKIGGTFRPV
ncbi:hypothetical protein PRIPAC_89711 [Pristionchus pacificus]|uniref:Hydrolase n=1 Tax=Pristionchus pacificus TaxID=54126 RepID=A0A2A6B5P8_PRIPA|nr:hypothetical protein PRIPAC_89711 [Pristionchus pacificus]|eukprot:PDM61197.1 hydrolase [Pristionchus pacificus]